MDTPLPAETVILPKRGWQIDSRHAVLAGAMCWIAFALITWLVHSGRTGAFDDAGLRLFRGDGDLALAGSPAWAEAVRDITALGGGVLRTIVQLGAFVALFFLRLRREAVLMVVTILTGLAIELAIKDLVGRPRPSLVPHLVEAGGMSFPSGHSFNSALGFIAIALAFATYSVRRRVRWTLIGSAAVLSMLVASSRVALGVHYPSDVIAGWLGGAGWAFLAEALFYRPAKAIADAVPESP
ncbi:phosphatase PAP2 family protein [Novosphingobium aquae]|uniref:Phosphatase PAP2 family protein n=1 Tax=Novosphingobium aquae TaxID=3133435 RepID=A0ABU8S8W4_9SPHN